MQQQRAERRRFERTARKGREVKSVRARWSSGGGVQPVLCAQHVGRVSGRVLVESGRCRRAGRSSAKQEERNQRMRHDQETACKRNIRLLRNLLLLPSPLRPSPSSRACRPVRWVVVCVCVVSCRVALRLALASPRVESCGPSASGRRSTEPARAHFSDLGETSTVRVRDETSTDRQARVGRVLLARPIEPLPTPPSLMTTKNTIMRACAVRLLLIGIAMVCVRPVASDVFTIDYQRECDTALVFGEPKFVRAVGQTQRDKNERRRAALYGCCRCMPRCVSVWFPMSHSFVPLLPLCPRRHVLFRRQCMGHDLRVSLVHPAPALCE